VIPRTVTDLDAMVVECERQTGEIEELLGPLSPDALSWRPNDRKWSALGHVAHLCLVNEPYLETIEGRLADARRRGDRVGDGPYRHPIMGRWFAGWMEPPPTRRLRTMKAMIPDPTLGSDQVLPRFRAGQAELVRLLQESRGVDLGRVRFGSPFAPVLRLSLGTAFATLLAHNRRHIWLIREVRAWEGAPASSTGDPRA
jgi:hypothetical protein